MVHLEEQDSGGSNTPEQDDLSEVRPGGVGNVLVRPYWSGLTAWLLVLRLSKCLGPRSEPQFPHL